jgi:fatty acid desaturase
VVTDRIQFDAARSHAIEQALADRVRFDTSRPRVRARRRKLVIATTLIANAALVGIGASAVVIGAPCWIALPSTHAGDRS